VRDSANKEARTALTLKSTGIEGLPASARRPKNYKPKRSFGSSSGFTRLTDVTFDMGRSGADGLGRRYDPAGRSFTLSPKLGWGGSPTIRVYSGESLHARLPAEGREFGAISSDGLGLFLLETDRKTVLRYPFGGRSKKWKDLFSKDAIEFGVPGGGTGNARFVDPVDIETTGDGDLYVLDAGQGCVQVFTTKGDRGVFLVSFGRPGTGQLELQTPKALAVTPDETVYVLDDGRKTVVVYRNWRPVSEFAVGAEGETLLGLAVDSYSGDVYVLASNQVKRFSRDGQAKGTFGEGPAGSLARIERPVRLRLSPARELWVVDREGEAVARFDTDGKLLGRRGGFSFSGHLRVAGGPSGEFAVLDREAYRVTRFDSRGWATTQFGSRGTKAGTFDDPVDIAVSAGGELLVLDAAKQTVLKFSPAGRYLRTVGTPGSGPRELTQVRDLTTVNNRAYIAVVQQRPEDNFNLIDPDSGRTVRYFGKYGGDMTPSLGCVLGVTGSLDSGSGRPSTTPWFWTVDDERERVHRQRRGRKPAGVVTDLDEVTDMEVSAADQVFVLDAGDDLIRVFDPEGSTSFSLSGSRFESPWDLGVDDFSHAYVYDRSSRRVVELVPAGN
jgi:hypothetical protein